MKQPPYRAFEVWGIEIESMIVDRDTLDVRPIADEALRDLAGSSDWVEDVEHGIVGWSNELVAHVIEMKGVAPVASLEELVEPFQQGVRRVDELLRKRGARLMPSAMHPWMDPRRETRLWPHDGNSVYRAYDRLFDCRRHGWANLQSVHLNLPFADEHEFGALMAAIRIVLPLIPALAASSPILDGRTTGALDRRLIAYRSNAKSCPSMAGEVVPEPIYRHDDYLAKVLKPIARELAELGADDVLLSREWTNARGAIARFDRMAIEIRVIDAQECPAADLAICAAVGGVVRSLYERRHVATDVQQAVASTVLVPLLDRCIHDGPAARLDPAYAALFGPDAAGCATAGELWARLVPATFAGPPALEPFVDHVLQHGPLARRLLAATGTTPDRDRLRDVYERLCDALLRGESFGP